MRKRVLERCGLMIVSMFLLFIPAAMGYVTEESEGTPSIEQPLIREGTLAVKMAVSLGLGTNSEVDAESWLGERDILPRNGWLADYPVTPDIIGELRKSVADAGDANKLTVGRDEAVKVFDRIIAENGVAITPAESEPAEPAADGNVTYPAASAESIGTFYANEGPPVVTYYEPPPYYYDMYSWVSYPFWYSGFWFGGFFILNDFHRPVFIGRDHHRCFVSNHFRDRDGDRFFRVDPGRRSPVGIGRGGRANGQATAINSGSVGFTGSRTRGSPANVATVNRSAALNSSSPARASMPAVSRTMTPPVRNYPMAQSSAPLTRSYGQSRSYTPSAGNFAPTMRSSAPTFHGSAVSAPAFRGGGSFSGGHGRR